MQAISRSTSLSASLYSSIAVKDGLYLLALKKRIQSFETKCLGNLLRISYLEHKTQDQRLGAKQDQLGAQDTRSTTGCKAGSTWSTRHKTNDWVQSRINLEHKTQDQRLGAKQDQLGTQDTRSTTGCKAGSTWNTRHKTNDWVQSRINFLLGPQEPLLATVERQKIAWFRHVTRHDSLSKTILQGTLEGGRRRGRQRKCCMDNIKEWTSLPMPELPTRACCRKDWKRISVESSRVSLRRSNRSKD